MLDDAAVISVQRDGKLIQPTDETVFKAGDVITLHVSPGVSDEALEALD
jgi:TrkA-C domain.